MAGKWLELLKEIAPQVTRVAVIHNPENQTWRANDPMPSNRRLSRQKTLWRQPIEQQTKPTILLVHGAWADSSSWNGVVDLLLKDGYTVRALPNTLRGLSADAAVISTYPEISRSQNKG